MLESLKTFYFKDIVNMPWTVALTLVLLVALAAALLIVGRKQWTAKRLAYAALCLAVSFVLSCIRLYRMPSGGSVVLCAMLPIVAYAVYCDLWQGILIGVAFGLLQLLQGAWIIHPAQGFLDYIAAYAVLGLGGLATVLRVPAKYRLAVGLVIAGLLRYCLHVVSGLLFFSGDALEAGQIPIIYSGLYNAFLFPEIILSVIVSLIPAVRGMFERTLGESVKG